MNILLDYIYIYIIILYTVIKDYLKLNWSNKVKVIEL